MSDILPGKTHLGHTSALLLMVATAVLWSTGGLMIKMVNCHPLAISGLRSAIACLFLLLIIRRPRFTWSWPQLAGAASFTATVIMFVLATRMTTAANAILLQYCAPIFVSLLGIWLLKEMVRPLDILTLVLVLAGLVLFFLDELSGSGFWGNVFGVLSGVSFACFFVFTRMDRNGPVIETILLGNIATAVIGSPFVFVQPPDTTGWIVLVLLGVLQLGLPYILYSAAIRHVTALEAILTCTIEPVLNPLWVLLFLGERPGTWAIVGGVIVLIAVTGRNVITAVTARVADRPFDGT